MVKQKGHLACQVHRSTRVVEGVSEHLGAEQAPRE